LILSCLRCNNSSCFKGSSYGSVRKRYVEVHARRFQVLKIKMQTLTLKHCPAAR